MSETFQEVDKVLKDLDLRFHSDAEKNIFQFKLESVLIRINCSQASVCIYSCRERNVPLENRKAVRKLLCDVNYKLVIGNWEMDQLDGEVRYKYALAFAKLPPSLHDRLLQALEISCSTFTKVMAEIDPVADAAVPGLAASSASASASSPPAAGPPQATGDTPLHEAVRVGEEETVLLLIEGGCDVNKANSAGVTPLMAAAVRGHTHIIRLLIDRGADVNAESSTQDTALSLAVFKRNPQSALVLLDAGADPNHVDKFGDTPLLDACALGFTDLVKKMVEAGADIEVVNKKGETPLSRAQNANHVQIVCFLEERLGQGLTLFG